VLANLLDNALKYGKPTQGAANVRLELSLQGRDIQIAVVDNGPGIPADDRERVLNRFVRLEASRNSPGSGLGLSLVAAIVRQLGSVLVLSDAEPGLRIGFTLPQAR
jgi:signal transduction histidine kinase